MLYMMRYIGNRQRDIKDHDCLRWAAPADLTNGRTDDIRITQSRNTLAGLERWRRYVENTAPKSKEAK